MHMFPPDRGSGTEQASFVERTRCNFERGCRRRQPLMNSAGIAVFVPFQQRIVGLHLDVESAVGAFSEVLVQGQNVCGARRLALTDAGRTQARVIVLLQFVVGGFDSDFDILMVFGWGGSGRSLPADPSAMPVPGATGLPK